MYKNIFEAIRANDEAAVKLFLSQKTDLAAKEPESGYDPFGLAAELGYENLIDLFMLPNEYDLLSLNFASTSQERFYFLDSLLEDPHTYYDYNIIEFLGKLNVVIFKQALVHLIQRHEILRTQFKLNENGRVIQEIFPDISPLVVEVDQQNQETCDVNELVKNEILFLSERFDLQCAPLWRVKLIYTAENSYRAIFVYHHIIIDGYSIGVFFKDLFAFYHNLMFNRPNLPIIELNSTTQFRDYAIWERLWMASSDYQTQINYWHHRLSGYASEIKLPSDLSERKILTKENGNLITLKLPEETHTKIIELSKRAGVTPFIVYLASYYVLLFKYTQQTDIVVGTPFVNRFSAERESAVGCYINTLAVRYNINIDQSFFELFGFLNTEFQNDIKNAQVPYNEIVNRDLIEVFFVYQLGLEKGFFLDGYNLPFETHFRNISHQIPGTAKYPLTFEFIKNQDNIYVNIEYRSDLYSSSFISKFFSHYLNILESVIVSPNFPIKDIQILSKSEIQQQLVEWNRTEKKYALTTVYQLFEALVKAAPKSIALVYENESMTYAELNVRANQVAHYLRAQGIGTQPDMLVGLGTERSFEMIIGILAILKAGGAYVPLDPTHPDERLRYMLQDTGVKYVLTNYHLLKRWEGLSNEANLFSAVALDRKAYYKNYSSKNLVSNTQLNHLAYVIYTSGTTGIPKGVMVEHFGLVNSCLETASLLEITSGTCALQFSSMNFDTMVWEWTSALTQGAALYLLSSHYPVLEALQHVLENHPIEVATLTPSVLRTLPENCFSHLKSLCVVGEALDNALFERWRNKCRFINSYGPAEVTIHAAAHIYDKSVVVPAACIGRPISNMHLYVLNKQGQVTPMGVPGELCIGGVGLARGYLNRSDLTEERFIWHRFDEESQPVRLYKTGDLVRILPDGNFEYIGRTDHQIKIRGMRVELGEIEAQLLKQRDITNAAVLVREEEEDKQLVAYVVTPSIFEVNTEEKLVFITELRKILSQFLPAHMIPRHIMLIEEMPLNMNGKVDRKALSVLSLEILSESTYLVPETETEKQLAFLWSKVLSIPVDKIGLNENFLALGGHSLSMMRLLSNIRESWQVELSLKSIFEVTTLAEMANVVDRHLGQVSKLPALTVQIRPEHIPLSFSQQRLWFLEQLLPDKALYHVPMALKLSGNRNIAALKKAYHAVIARHEILRTRFDHMNGEAVQIVEAADKIPELNVQHIVDLVEEVGEYLKNCLMQPFNFGTGPMIRGELIIVSEKESILFVVMHHIITDGVSMEVYLKDLLVFYEHYAHGKPAPVPLSIHYIDYSLWQQGWLQGERLQAQVDYWKQQLNDIPEMITLPTDYARPKELTYAGGKVSFNLGKEILATIHHFSRTCDVTVFMVMLSALQIMLHRYSGQEVIIVGSPIANRRVEQTESLIGFFVNTLALKSEFKSNLTVVDFLKQIRKMTLNAYEHQDISFEQMVTHLEIKRQENVNPVFQVMLAYQEDEIKRSGSEDFNVSLVREGEYPIAKFDLTLQVIKTSEGLDCQLEYSKDLFKEETVKCFTRHFQTILNSMIANPYQIINQLPMLDMSEIHQQLSIWNQAEEKYPQATFHELFEKQVRKTPKNIALVYEDQQMTYIELNARANQVAHYLREQGIGTQPDMLVGLGVERSFEMMIGLLAILKAGGAYVPLEPTHPNERIQEILKEAQAKILLTQSHLQIRFQTMCEKIISIDDTVLINHYSKANLDHWTKLTDLAYVIYTSGSTGKPKGVLIEHKGVPNLGLYEAKLMNLTDKDVVLQFFSHCFDAMVSEWSRALLTGASLCLISEQSLHALITAIKQHKVTVATLPPSFLALVNPEDVSSLRVILSTTEAFNPELLNKWKSNVEYLINGYGPTENTVATTHLVVTGEYAAQTIGKPMINVQCYLLDEHERFLPPGVPGEIYITGLGLARGYLNRDDLTAEKFKLIRLTEESGFIRAYRTGDIARYARDGSGNIEYIGRVDNQIKMHGFRIELGEIEARLLENKVIEQATVLAREDSPGKKQLVAYVVGQEEIDVLLIKDHLKKVLPYYMIPQQIVVLKMMPLTSNGKVDKRALLALPLDILSAVTYVAPMTDTEKQLAALWSEVLQIPVQQIGLKENFFELGGHSLLLMRLLTKIREMWKIELALKSIFGVNTLAEMAKIIDQNLGRVLSLPVLTSQIRPEHIPLSFNQQRLWFLEQLLPGKSLYHVPLTLKLKGKYNISALKHAYSAMVERHESLRTRFKMVNEKAVQIIESVEKISALKTHQAADLMEDISEYLERNLFQPFNFTQGPLIRGELIAVNEEESILFIVMHHIITDGVSMEIYLKDYLAFYEHYAHGKPAPKPLSIHYIDYTLWQRDWLQGERLQAQVDYWKQQLRDIPEIIELPIDYVRPKELTYAGGRLRFSLGNKILNELYQFSRTHDVTVFMVLLAALQATLHRYSSQEVIVIGSPIANRRVEQVESLIGFFVNTLALKARFSSSLTVEDLLKQIRIMTLDAYEHQDIPFEQLVTHLDVTRQTNVNPIFQVMLAYQETGKTSITTTDFDLSFLEEGEYRISKFDLSLQVVKTSESLHCQLEYSKDLFKEETVRHFAQHFQTILKGMIMSPHQTVNQLPMLEMHEIHQQLIAWNQTEKLYPETTIHKLFEAQVENTPDNIALVYEDQAITYAELNARANQVAHYLRAQGVGSKPDMLVGLGTERSVEMIVAMLAIVKVGGAYVPMDPTHPDDRLHYMLQDAQVTLLLTQQHLVSRWKGLMEADNVLALDQATWWQSLPVEDLTNNTQPQDLAYVLYTSGTTGKPKGVMITHHSLVNLILAMNDKLRLQASDRFLALTSMSFDIAELEWHAPLLCGASMLLANPQQVADIETLLPFLKATQPTVMQATPSRWTMLLEAGWQAEIAVKILVGGEALNKPLATNLLQQTDEVWNVYGPTETTIWSSCVRITADSTIHIGEALANTQLYVLNEQLGLLPIGATGELYIGGRGLARGYLNRPELTAERFIWHKFSENSEPVRLYKTGDLVRYLPNGNLEYAGRADHQIKLRGFRIELGEIEAQLLEQANVTQAVVLVHVEQNNKQLVAYLVAPSIFEATVEERNAFMADLKVSLSQFLPDYMIPNYMMLIEKMPLNVNGKIDRKALPAFVIEFSEIFSTPQNEVELKIAQVWQEVLGRKELSVEEDFFRQGGDSILSIQVVSKLRSLGIDLSVKQIFEHRTIRALARQWMSAPTHVLIQAEQGRLEGEFSLLPIQQYFFEKKYRRENHWNQAFLIKVPQLDKARLGAILPKLADYHDALRLRYAVDKQQYIVHVETPRLVVLNGARLSEESIQKQLTDWQSHFDIANGPVWQMGYIEGYEDGSARIFMALHHLIVDAVSWRILAEDIKTLYEGRELSPKTSSYRQWVKAVNTYADAHKEELSYWQEIVADQHEYTISARAATVYNVGFNETLTKELIQSSSQAYYTEINDLLLTALAYALKTWDHQEVYHILLESHGREKIAEEINVDHTLGWFTTIYPVKLVLAETLESSIYNIKESLHTIPMKGLGYGVFRYLIQDETLKNKPLPSIVFNYLGQFPTTDAELWKLVGETAGESISSNNHEEVILNINGAVLNGCLQFSFTSKLEAALSQRIVRAFENTLSEIIRHCGSQLHIGLQRHTPSDFNYTKLTPALLSRLESNGNVEEIYPANSLQQGFIYHAAAYPQDDAYRVQILMDIHEALNIDCYRLAWEKAIETYPVLRMAFSWEEQFLQIVYRTGNLFFEFHDISAVEDKKAVIRAIQQADRKEKFDLTQPTLLRLHLIKQSENCYTLLKNEHHAISDGWSGPVLLNQIYTYYHSLIEGKAITIEQDKSYLKTQEYIITHKTEASAYWKHQLARVEEVNDLSLLLQHHVDLDHVRIIQEAREVNISLMKEQYDRLRAVVKTQGLTINVLLQYAWHKLIQVYTRAETTIVGTTVSGRGLPIEGIEQSVGLYINTLPLIMRWREDETVIQQLQLIHQKIIELNNYSYVDLASLQHSGKRLFHSLFIFENFPIIIEENNRVKINFSEAIEKLDYPFAIVIYETQESISISLKYAGEYLEEAQAQRLLEQMILIFQAIPEHLEKTHTNINLVSEREYQLQRYEWTRTEKAYPQMTTIQQLFEKSAMKVPNNIALEYEGQVMTYAELNTRANQVAYYLRGQGIGLKPDMLVGVGMERSFEMIIGILAILKAGGAYVPLEPAHPDERLRYMLQDMQVEYILTQSHLLSRWENLSNKLISRPSSMTEMRGGSHRIIRMDSSKSMEYKNNYFIRINSEKSINNIRFFVALALDEKFDYDHFPSENIPSVTQANHLAYVIYTSGSTGQPKGVMIEHRNVLNYLFNINEQFSSSKHVDFSSNLTFDLSVTTTLYPLCFGKTIFIFGGNILDNNLFVQHLERNKIDLVKSTPGLMSIIHNRFSDNYRLKYCIVGGEKLDKHSATSILKYSKHIIDEYGPTETTVGSMCFWITDETTSYSIGKNYHNYINYVFNTSRQLVPTGVVGELYIGGAGLARGYLNRPELTEDRFIWHRFDDASEPVRLYKTGDLVRYLPDGSLEYIGRADHQIKLRGFRVELGEIETQLLLQEHISSAAVIVRENSGNKQLIAYLVIEKEFAADLVSKEEFIRELRKELSVFLTEYMIPSHMILLEEMPLTVNGKIDRKALRELKIEFSEHANYVAPITETEQALAQLWSRLLSIPVERISVNNNFFDLGGNSLLLILLLSNIKDTLNLKVSFAQFYLDPTIKGLCSTSEELIKLDPSLVPLSPQKKTPPLFLIHAGFGMATYYSSLLPALKDYSLYGVNYENILEGELKYYTSLEELASSYIIKIKTAAPQGPYRLGGWSTGGIISLEMTRQLQAAGEEVELIFLLDYVYHTNLQLENINYLSIFISTFLANTEFGEQSDITRRFVQVSHHLQKLTTCYRAQHLNQLIKKVALVKCQGSLIHLSAQEREKLESDAADFFNGVKHFFSDEQSLHIRTILCNHYELFDSKYVGLLNKQVQGVLSEPDDHAFSLKVNEQFSNFIHAIEQGDAFALRRLLAENEYALIDAKNEDGRSLIEIAFECHQASMVTYLLKHSKVLRRTYQWIRAENDIERQYFLLNIDQTDFSLCTIYLLQRNYTLNLLHVLAYLYKQFNRELIHSFSISLLELSPPYMLTCLSNLLKNIAILHLISAESLDLVAAAVIDEIMLALPLTLAEQLSAPMGNYLNQATNSNSPQKVGRAFNAGLVLSLSMLVPTIIYSVFARNFMKSIGAQEPISEALGQLTLTRLLAVAPMLINLCIEQYYAVLYRRYKASAGAMLDAIFTVTALILFSYAGTLNASNLGYSMAIGSFAKSIYYLQGLIRQGDWQRYAFGQTFPRQKMYQYWCDSHKSVLSAILPFVNYLVLAILVLNKNGNLELTGFKIARIMYDVVSLFSPVVTATSSFLMGRLLYSQQYGNALVLGVLALSIGLILTSMLSLVFGLLTGEEITKAFISLKQLSVFVQPIFFDNIKENIGYFIGLSLSQILQTLLMSYLAAHAAFRDILKTFVVSYFLFTNIGLIGMYYGQGGSVNDLIKITLSGNLLTTVILLYQWLKLSSFELESLGKNKIVQSKERHQSTELTSISDIERVEENLIDQDEFTEEKSDSQIELSEIKLSESGIFSVDRVSQNTSWFKNRAGFNYGEHFS